MAFLPYNPTGGGAGSVAGEYVYKQNEEGQLELWKGDQKVAMQSPDGSWFVDNISTGVGSLHLGGNDSGGVAHSLGSAGQNVGFKNEFSKLAEDERLFFYPPWQAVSCDGINRVPASFREYGARSTTVTPNGARQLSGEVFYNFDLSASSNSEVYQVTFYPTEAYTGKLRNVIISRVTNAEIYDTTADVVTAIDSSLSIKYKYPFSLRAGDLLKLQLIKEDGTFLKCRPGSADVSIPFRQLVAAPFSDRLMTASSYGDTKQSYQSADHDGWVLLDGRAKSTLTATQQVQATALGFGVNLPDTRDRLLMSAGGLYAHKTLGGSYSITRSDLPNFTLTGDTGDTNTAHTHGVGTLATATAGVHAHVIPQLSFNTNTSSVAATSSTNPFALAAPTAWTMDSEVGGDLTGTIRKYPAFASVDATSVFSDTSHSHSVSGFTAQGVTDTVGSHTHTLSGSTGAMSANATHKHSYTTESINGNVTQTAHVPAYAALNHFVFLGA